MHPMNKLFLLIFFTLLFSNLSEAQFTRYIVQLKNKGGNPFSLSNPSAYLSQRAISRRTKYIIPIDSTDLPVTPSYITQIKSIPNVVVLNASKWLNSVSIQTTDANAINTINALPFVQSVTGIAARIALSGINNGNKFFIEKNFIPLNTTSRVEKTTADFFNYGTTSFNEINLHKAQLLHNIGLRGQGMQVAMLDNGFNNYTTQPAFDSTNLNAQVLGTWDFVALESNVINDGSHGMSCMSTIAANIPGQFIGKAPKVSFWLFKTEDDASEYPIEEHNWACGAERADSSGADIISSSLGYGYDFNGGIPNYPYSTLNGNTTMSARAADLAAKKGMLVFIAAGNEGATANHFISTPADGDSVIAVGAVNSSGVIGSFSSFGPSGDGQIKPDMASVGVSALVQFNGGIGGSNGTSFACPNMAGLGTILWQAFPEFNNMKIRSALWQAGSISNTPDDRMGYGIPDLKKAFTNLLIEYATSASSLNECKITVNWSSKDVGAMKYEIERKAPGESVFTKIAEQNPTAGNILTNHSYQFVNTLTTGSSGIFSYRIRQIIDTAVASFTDAYIDTTAFSISSSCVITGIVNPDPTKDHLSLMPNPASGDFVTLVIETKKAVPEMPILIYDMKGQLVMKMQKSKGIGQSFFQIPIARLARGKYIIKVFNKQNTIGTADLIKL